MHVTCFGMSNGSVSATVSGGTGPFGYLWSPGGQTTATISGLVAGTYSVAVTDSSDMSVVSNNITITEPPQIFAAASSGTTCPGSCVGIVSTATGGTPPYTYMWTPSNFLSNAYIWNPVSCPPTTQTYTLMVADMNGCLHTSTTTVFVSTTLAATLTPTSTPCGSCNGSITANVTGGSGSYTYSWSGPGGFTSTLQNPTSLCDGIYTLTVGDGSGCFITETTIVNGTGGPTITLDSISHVTCSGSFYGSLGITASGGTAPYSYTWSNGTTTPAINMLSPGTYSVTVTDASGCDAYATYSIVNSSTIYAYAGSTSANCSSNGTATAFVYSGVPPYTFQWDDPLSQTTATATNLAAGSYNFVVTDASGCTASGWVTVMSTCHNVIKGRVYDDANSNCVQDAGEPGIAGRSVVASTGGGSTYGWTDVNGDYTIFTTAMNPTITVYNGYTPSYMSPTCPASGSLSVTVPSLGDTVLNNNFGYFQDPSYFDLVIHPGWSQSNPGFQKTYWICYYNASPTPQNATIRFVYDPVLVFVSATMGGVHNASTHTIEWNYTALAPATIWDWAARPIITFNVPASVPITANLSSYFEILPVTGDAYPYDNTLTSNEPVTGSHDPNAKEVMPAGYGATGNILPTDTLLHYKIHFQNNGNDTAYTVVVKDTLSSYLDPASIVPGAASHPYTFDLSAAGVLTFRFDAIMLPDSISDYYGSMGNFEYDIKVKPGMPLGTVIENTAHIYFDFNEAVVTNTTVNTISLSTGSGEDLDNDHGVTVYPNPFSDQAIFSTKDIKAPYNFELKNVLGQTVRSITGISGKEFSLLRSELEAGIYFYTISTDQGPKASGKVIIR
jgi:hypothetical protein